MVAVPLFSNLAGDNSPLPFRVCPLAGQAVRKRDRVRGDIFE